MTDDVTASTSAAPEILSVTASKLKDGVEALRKGQHEHAVESIGAVLKSRTAHFGEFAMECALPAYYYGVALLQLAQSTRDVFADEEVKEPDAEAAEDEKPSDLALAWEALECARHAYEKQTNRQSSPLASVHVVLGDVACETSNFADAWKEYKAAIEYLTKVREGEENAGEDIETHDDGKRSMHRRFCEVYYKMCLACEYLHELSQAAEYCEKAIVSIQAEIEEKEGSDTQLVEELQGIETDLVAKKEEVDIACKENDQVKELLRKMFEQHVNKPTTAEVKKSEVVDLGVVGRGKSRLTTVKEESPKKDRMETESAAKRMQTPSKRTTSAIDDVEESLSKRKKIEEDKDKDPGN